MAGPNDEFIGEFLEECVENLDQLEQDLVALEQAPRDAQRLASIFRTVHTIKGNSGFFGFAKLGALTHAGETLLGRLRDGRLTLTAENASALLEMSDAVRGILGHIEKERAEPETSFRALADRLTALSDAQPSAPATPPPSVPPLPPTALPADETPADETPADETPADETPADETPADETPAAAAKPLPAAPAAAVETEVADPRGTSPAAEQSAEAKPAAGSAAAGTIRVDVALLDEVVDLVGELVLARNHLLRTVQELQDRTVEASLAESAHRLDLVTSGLQERVLKTRMQPIGAVWNKLPRVVRDVARQCGKDVDLTLAGEDTELDRSLLEAIRDPLTHIVRNAIDHGIEPPEKRKAAGKPVVGKLAIRAWHESGQVNVEIADDGRGIDPRRVLRKAIERGVTDAATARTLSEADVVRLVFRPGFSTAEKVTDLSGRGVGMDVVRTNIERIGGTIDLRSRVGEGSAVRLKIPLTLAILPALIVVADGQRFAIPQIHLVELLRLDTRGRKRLEWVGDVPLLRCRDDLLPLLDLRCELRLDDNTAAAAVRADGPPRDVVVLQADSRRLALVVDSARSTEEIVVKPLHRALARSTPWSGATLMGDGQVALILDVSALADRNGLHSTDDPAAEVDLGAAVAGQAAHAELLLTVQVGTEQFALPLRQVDRLEDFAAKDVESSGGREVVQYRGRLLPLLDMAAVLGRPAGPRGTTVPTVVVRDPEGARRSADGRIGLAVDAIRDVVPLPLLSEDHRLPDQAVLHGQVTAVVDALRLTAGRT